LGLSPHTFLHEYYHIAETVPAYLTDDGALGLWPIPALLCSVWWAPSSEGPTMFG